MNKVFVYFLLIGVFGCASQGPGSGAKYNAQNDQTVLTFSEHGAINVPKRWTEVYYHEGLGARSCRDADSTALTVNLFAPEDNMSLEKGSTLADYASLMVFMIKHQSRIDTLQNNTVEGGYILLRVQNPDDKMLPATLLFGTKRGLLYDFGCTSTTWSQEETNTFLVKLFLDN